MKTKSIHIIIEYLYIILGTFIMSLGLTLFLVPNKVSTGGVTSIATMLLYIFNIPLSSTNLICNIFLFIFAYKYLGKAAIIKTIWGVIFFSLFLELTAFLPVLSKDFLISSVSGGILMGIGVGLVLRHNASTGGSDLAALIFNRLFPHISVANLILIIDFSVVIIAGFVFKSFQITFYSILSIFIFAKVTDVILTMGSYAKSIYILSDKSEEISVNIMARIKRGVTGIRSTGMYSQDEQTMLMCITSAKELPVLIHLIRKADKNAFIIISDVREVLGKGFKEKTSYDDIP